MSAWLKQPLLLGQQPDEENVSCHASCPTQQQAIRSRLYGLLALQLSAVLLPAAVLCIASLAYSEPTQHTAPTAAAAIAVSQWDVLRLQAAAVCSVLALGLSSSSLWHSHWRSRQLVSCLLLLCACWAVVSASILAGSSSSSSSASLHWLPDTLVQAVLSLAVVLPAAPLFTLTSYSLFTLQSQREFTPEVAEGFVTLCSIGFAALLLLLAAPGSYPLQFLLLAVFELSGRVFCSYAVEYVGGVVHTKNSSSSSSSSSKSSTAVKSQHAYPVQYAADAENGGDDNDDAIAAGSLSAALFIAMAGGSLVLLSIASLATIFVAADASTLLLRHSSSSSSISSSSSAAACNPLWASAAHQLPIADVALLLLGAVSVLLHGTYAAAHRLQLRFCNSGFGVVTAAGSTVEGTSSSSLHPLLLIGLQLSCLGIGVLLGLASCAV
uniref:Uncharacterized protein n=1 Tax=Tetradesmus obliquus TaxID=3088 RepID=A0A383WA17_TETOB|eukprot:jgi/Sobl393_1/13033/SZX74301.1